MKGKYTEREKKRVKEMKEESRPVKDDEVRLIFAGLQKEKWLQKVGEGARVSFI